MAAIVWLDVNLLPLDGAPAALVHIGALFIWGVMMIGLLSISPRQIVEGQGGKVESKLPETEKQALVKVKPDVEEIAKKAGVARAPELAMDNSDELNAFAASNWFGRSIICFSPEAMQLPRNQLRALIAHEMAHIARGDSLVQSFLRSVVFQFTWTALDRTTASIGSTVKGTLWILAIGAAAIAGISGITGFTATPQLQALAWLAGAAIGIAVIAKLVQFSVKTQTTFGAYALSRHMEMKADRLAAKWTSPEDMLKLIETLTVRHQEPSNPHWSDNLVSTHPSHRKRMARLQRMIAKK